MRNRSVLTRAIPAIPPTLVLLGRTLVLGHRRVVGPSVAGDRTRRLGRRVDRLVDGAIPHLGRQHQSGPVVPLHTAGRHRGKVVDVPLHIVAHRRRLEGDDRSRTRHRRGMVVDALLRTADHRRLRGSHADGLHRTAGHRVLVAGGGRSRIPRRRGKLVDGLRHTVAHRHLLVDGDGLIRTRRHRGLAPDVGGASHTTRGVPVRTDIVAHRLDR